MKQKNAHQISRQVKNYTPIKGLGFFGFRSISEVSNLMNKEIDVCFPNLQNSRKKLITFLPLSCYNNDEWYTPWEMLLNHPVNCLLYSRSHPQICWPSGCSWQAQLSKSVFLAQIPFFQNCNLFICKKGCQ